MQHSHLLIKPGEPRSILKDGLTALLAALPTGVKVRYEITDGLVVWSVEEKPVSFPAEEEKTLLAELNELSLRFSAGAPFAPL